MKDKIQIVEEKQSPSSLKILARINILIAQVKKSDQALGLDEPIFRVRLLCGLAELRNDNNLLDEAYNSAKSETDPYLKAACMICIAYADRKINPIKKDFSNYLDHCKGLDLYLAKAKEVNRWVQAFNKNEPYAPKVLTEAGKHHMTQFAYHLQEGNFQKAREATRSEPRNLFWRVEALCMIANAERG